MATGWMFLELFISHFFFELSARLWINLDKRNVRRKSLKLDLHCARVISQSSEGRLVIHRAHFFADRRAEKRKGKTSHEVSGTVLDARCRSI